MTPSTSIALVVTGAAIALTVANHDLPILRNALVYADASYNILDTRYSVGEVVNQPAFGHGKPIGFSLMAAPAVAAFGANTGLQIASCVGGLLCLVAAFAFFRRMNDRAGVSSRWVPVQIAAMFGTPLVMYQFWSAYPDMLFSAWFLLSMVFLDDVLRGRRRPLFGVAAYVGFTILAMITKYYGVVLPALHGVYCLVYWGEFRDNVLRNKPVLAGACVAVMAFAATIGSALAGLNPLMALGSGSSGAGDFATAILALDFPLVDNLRNLALFVALGIGLPIVFALRGVRATRAHLALGLVAGGYTLPLLMFNEAFNMRYFLAASPFLLVFVAVGLQRAGAAHRRAVLAVGFTANVALVLFYNVQSFHEAVRPHAPGFLAHDPEGPLDNLRLEEHLRRRADLRQLNDVEHRAVVYYVSRYYGNAEHGIYERSGLLRSDIEIRYRFRPPTERTLPTGNDSFYVYSSSEVETRRTEWYWTLTGARDVARLGPHVLRVTRS